jgi:hypothetical protein
VVAPRQRREFQKGGLSNQEFHWPPLAHQTAFAHQVERIEAVARNLDVTSAAAEAMAAALSAEVFG